MPHDVAGTQEVMAFVSRGISPATYVNVMDQYRPCGEAGEDRLIHRRLSAGEYRKARKAALEAGITRLDSREHPRILFSL